MTVQSTKPAGRFRSVRNRSRPLGRLRRTGAARWDADFLDGLVDTELEFVRRLPVHLRARPVELLAVLVMLAQTTATTRRAGSTAASCATAHSARWTTWTRCAAGSLPPGLTR